MITEDDESDENSNSALHFRLFNIKPRLNKCYNGIFPNAKERFADAADVIWELHPSGPNQYTLITSDYWVNRDDITADEVSGSIKLFEER